MVLESAARLQADAPTRQAALELYDKMVENARKNHDANDFLYWVDSSWDYDPQPGLGKIKAKVVAVNFATTRSTRPSSPSVEKLVRSGPGRALRARARG